MVSVRASVSTVALTRQASVGSWTWLEQVWLPDANAEWEARADSSSKPEGSGHLIPPWVGTRAAPSERSIHGAGQAAKLGVTFPPSDMPWGAREMPSTLGLAP
jgi:hypothetical protein